MARDTAVVIAPGRGTYNAPELGYLARWHSDKVRLLETIDGYRAHHGRSGVRELDAAERFSPGTHGLGANAAGLIYASAMADYLDIDPNRYEIVAVTGNSMGWYLALTAAGVTRMTGTGIELTETMASLMDAHGTGGQSVYPVVDDAWQPAADRQRAVRQALADAAPGTLFESIRLGGSVVLAGTDAALGAAEATLPKVNGRFPLRLARHAAFHTPLLEPVSRLARERLPAASFAPPLLPLIDGRGEIWQPGSNPAALQEYTLGQQVTRTYDFSRALSVALKEFAPDKLILLGPGSTMGAPVLQQLVQLRWLGLADKAAWLARQAQNPFLLAMGIAEQRQLVIREQPP